MKTNRDRIILTLLAFCIVLGVCSLEPTRSFAGGDLSAKQARNLISQLPGVGLKGSAIEVASIATLDASTAAVTAEITTAFQFWRQPENGWQVATVRIGPGLWEGLDLSVMGAKAQTETAPCRSVEGKPVSGNLDVRTARCLLERFLGFADSAPSSRAVRIKEISGFSLPLNSRPSALVEAIVPVDFRFSRAGKKSWQVAGVRTGNLPWTEPETMLNALNRDKTTRARLDLETLANALEKFRLARGHYVEGDSAAALVDFLSPDYLDRVIRVDPWFRPYVYQGSRDQFTLRSSGPDRKENTPDDIVLNHPQASGSR